MDQQAGRTHHDHSRDAGVSFIELLIAIVLLGTATIAVLTAVQVGVIGSKVERDHAKAYQWLQSASAAVKDSPRVSCDYDPIADAAFADGEEKVRLSYQNEIQSTVVNPPGWNDPQISVVYPVKIWDGTQYWEPAAAPKTCFDADGFFLQLVTLQVTSPDNEIIETLQVVKRD